MPHPPNTHPRDAFEDRVVELLPELYAAAVRYAKNDADAEDLVAESVAKAWRKLDTLDDFDALRGWIFRILTNTFVSRCRSDATRPDHDPWPEASPGSDHGRGHGDRDAGHAGNRRAGGFSLYERLHVPFLLWRDNPEQRFLNRLLREDLERAVDALPEPFRVVVVLAQVEGFTYREVSETLEIPVGTVRSRLARARERLQESLWKHAVDSGLVEPDSSSRVNRS